MKNELLNNMEEQLKLKFSLFFYYKSSSQTRRLNQLFKNNQIINFILKNIYLRLIYLSLSFKFCYIIGLGGIEGDLTSIAGGKSGKQ